MVAHLGSDTRQHVVLKLSRLAIVLPPPPFTVRRALALHFEMPVDRIATECEAVEGAKCTVYGFRGRWWTATTGRALPRDRRWNWALVPSAATEDHGWSIWWNILVERPF